ncbi:MAG: hypothetical protein GY847_37095 [Proteobacteria bacterium]|nr:hypothetical protein [Pseudomonadota bacterium]
MKLSRREEIFRGAICPRCKKTFYICRRCDRGHVYCSKQCAYASRVEKCRVYRERYRHGEKMREYHRNRERERRREIILGKRKRGDHTYGARGESAKVSVPVRMVAALAAIGSVGGEETKDGEVCCEFCGRRAIFVYFGDGSTRQRKQGTVFRHSD